MIIDPKALPYILRVEDIVQILSISRSAAYELIHRGCPHMLIGKKSIRIPRDAFFLYLAEQVQGEGGSVWQQDE